MKKNTQIYSAIKKQRRNKFIEINLTQLHILSTQTLKRYTIKLIMSSM